MALDFQQPFEGVAKLKENNRRTRYLSGQERAKLLPETAKDATLHCLVVLALSTAARVGELVRSLGGMSTSRKDACCSV